MSQFINYFRIVHFAPVLEKEFLDELKSRAFTVLFLIYALGGVITLIYFVQTLAQVTDFWHSQLPLRLVYMVFWASLFYLTFFKKRLSLPKSYLIYAFGGAIAITYFRAIDTADYVSLVPSLLLFLIGLVVSQLGSRIQAKVGAVILLVPTTLIFLFIPADHPLPVPVITQLAIWSISAYIASIVLEKTNRTLFSYRKELAAAREREKLANDAKSVFLANMSHEIRTPLTSIIGYAESVLEDPMSAEQQRDSMRTIRNNGLHLLSIINDILDISKIEAGKIEIDVSPVELCQLVSDIESFVHHTAVKKGLSFELAFEFPLPSQILLDQTRVRQVLLNLLNNAIKFTDKGSVTLRIAVHNQQLQFTVTDTGIGITENQLKRLFRPFVQADHSTTRKYGGTGLGLVISKKLAKLMGGDLTVSSIQQQGSQFCMSLPLATTEQTVWLDEQPCHRVQHSQPPLVLPSQLSGDILLAEDHPDNRQLIANILTLAGLTVTTVENGEQAVSKAVEKEFDLILLDMQMPNMDGLTALQYIKASGYCGPVIVLTANVLKHEVEHYLEQGFSAWLPKPFNRQQLLTTIAEHLAQTTTLDVPDISQSNEYQRLKQHYLLELPLQLTAVEQAVAVGNWPDVARVSHMIHGSAGNFELHDISELAAQLEQSARQADGQQSVQRLQQLQHCWSNYQLLADPQLANANP